MDEPRARPDDAVSVALANLTENIANVDDLGAERVQSLDRLVESRFTASETALDAAKEALDARMKAGDQELLSHIQAQRVSVDAALAALKDLDAERDKAQTQFETTVRERFAQVNEFRRALDDLGKLMATRREFEDQRKATDQREDELAKQIVALGSRLDIGNPAIGSLQQQQAAIAARAGGIGDGAKMLAAVLSTLLVLIGIYTALQATNRNDTPQPPQTVTVTTP